VVLPNVVAAMQRGALSYFQWPDDVDELIELIAWTVTTAAAGTAGPAAAGIMPAPAAAGPHDGSAPNGSGNGGNGNGHCEASPKALFLTPDPVRLGLVTRKADAQARLGTLSRREMEVLRLVATGHSSSQIGEMLNISRRTVESHRSSILNKTQSQSTAQVLRWAIEGEVI
jgi:DNA-binding CsgD family transcriptional regulator